MLKQLPPPPPPGLKLTRKLQADPKILPDLTSVLDPFFEMHPCFYV